MSLRLSRASGLAQSLEQRSRALPLRPQLAVTLLSSSSISSSASASSSASSSSSVSARPFSRQFHTSGPSRAAAAEFAGRLSLPADYVPPTQPPSARRPDFHKAQLLRTYTSLLRSTPLMLIFQHNNLTGPEWTALRRELVLALRNASERQADQWPVDFDGHIRLQVVRSRMLNLALKVTEFFDPVASASAGASAGASTKKVYSHDLSVAAYETVKKAEADGLTTPDRSVYGQLAPLLVGPLALLTFPAVSPVHLAAALSVLAPAAPAFPPPSRKKSPGYYEPAVQSALQKLLLVGGRVEGKAMDTPALHWVGSLGATGGLAGLQAQLVALLQSAGLGLTSTLEGTGKSLWLTMESRRTMLEEPPVAEDKA